MAQIILKLTNEQNEILDRIEKLEGVVFLTGKAGTGKSTMLNIFKKSSNYNAVCLAPTGVASILIGGQTIHSFFKFPAGWITSNHYKPIPKKLVSKIDIIIIDEISMVRADIIDHMDQVLRISTKKDIPFGGIPMLWIGDLFQLPPVVSSVEEKEYFKTHYTSPFFFSSKIFKKINNFEIIELKNIWRQNEKLYLKFLDQIRFNTIDQEELDDYNEIILRNQIPDNLPIITLTGTNAAAQNINLAKLSQIQYPSKMFHADITGTMNGNNFPTDKELVLKIGAQVMTVKNDPDKRYFNGSLGMVTRILENSVFVKLENEEDEVEITKTEWDIVKYKLYENQITTEVVGTFSQLPLKTAWAITIHKSQGKTFDRALIDLGSGAFESGQVYVALSRCRSLDGVYLSKKLKMSDILTDERIIDFFRTWQ